MPQTTTASGVRHLCNIVDYMREHQVALAGDIRRHFNMNGTNLRRYVRMLEEAGIVTMEMLKIVNQKHYQVAIIDDEKVVDSFLEDIMAGEPMPQQRARIEARRRRLALAGGGRRGNAGRDGDSFVHVMEDDVKFAIKIDRRAVSRDPLVVALFGEPKFGVEHEPEIQ